MTAAAVTREILDLLLPRGCLACGMRIPPEDVNGMICPSCRVRLRPPPAPFCARCQAPRGTGQPPGEVCLECRDWPEILVSARAAVVLDPAAGALIHALKYRGWRNIAQLMGEKMLLDSPSVLVSPLVVPVPTTSWRRRTRGYNQAAVLAEVFSGFRNLPMKEVLYRGSGRTQVRLGPRERAMNVQGAFTVRTDSRSRIQGRDVILVDDVLTTGATAKAAARALEAGGAATVHLRTFARALPFSLR